MRPVNIASKKAYRGVNVVALWAYAEEFGFSSGTCGTCKPPRPALRSARPRKPPSSSSTRSLSSPSPRLATPRRQGFSDLLTPDCALAFQFPNDNPSDCMAAGGFGQFALQFRHEALCTGKNLVPAASFKSQRGPLSRLGLPPIPG